MSERIGRTPATSFRPPPDLLEALRKKADEDGATVSDMLRLGALMVLGICPTCGQKAPAADDNDPGKDPC